MDDKGGFAKERDQGLLEQNVGRFRPIDVSILRGCYLLNASIEPIIKNLTAKKKLKEFDYKIAIFFRKCKTFSYLCTPRNQIIPMSLNGIDSSPDFRDVAQPGSALAWGARGRWFESSRPDKNRK